MSVPARVALLVLAASSSLSDAFAPHSGGAAVARGADSVTSLRFGFLKDLGLEKPDFLPDFGAKEEEVETNYVDGIAVGDAFPKSALKKFGVAGKKSVVYFYGADDAPSCKKQNEAFNERIGEFQSLGATVVGVRNESGVKDDLPELVQALAVDEGDEIRTKIGIKKDLFGLLGGRETYVIGKDGRVEYVFNDQFKPEAHVDNTIDFLSS